MSNLYGTTQITSVDEMAQRDEIIECLLVDDVLQGSSEDIKKFCESAEAQVLVEKQVLNKPTLIRMSKEGDYNRRVKLICYTLAKNANDPLWAKLVKFQKAKKEYSQKIYDKYCTKAARIAKASQKEYIKKAKAAQATAEEKKAQAATK